MSIRIASFNAYKFSTNTHKDVSIVAQIIKDYEIDIIAIQEIFSKDAMIKLKNELGTQWKGYWEPPTPYYGSAQSAEGYSFLWNTRRFHLSKNRTGKEFTPRIFSQYAHKDFGKLVRDPLYGRFTLNSNEMIEIRLLNTHIVYSMDKQINDSDERDITTERIGDITMRKRELEILTSRLLPKIDNKDYDAQYGERDGICRRPYTILLGDYNLNLKESGAKGAFIDNPIIEIIDADSKKVITTIQTDLSTLKSKTHDNPNITGYSNNFDHFTYDSERSIKTSAYALKIPSERKYGLDYDAYKKDVSDHLMIVLDLDLI